MLCPKDKRLKFKWQWIRQGRLSRSRRDPRRGSYKRKPCQCSEAVLKNGWTLEAVFWHCDYGANVDYYENTTKSYRVHYDEGTKKKP
ncbi:MAG: hypothetical protein QQN41_09650, partial [Nitrosopumilus sp.]